MAERIIGVVGGAVPIPNKGIFGPIGPLYNLVFASNRVVGVIVRPTSIKDALAYQYRGGVLTRHFVIADGIIKQLKGDKTKIKAVKKGELLSNCNLNLDILLEENKRLNFSIPYETITDIEVRKGSFLWRPAVLVIKTDQAERKFLLSWGPSGASPYSTLFAVWLIDREIKIINKAVPDKIKITDSFFIK